MDEEQLLYNAKEIAKEFRDENERLRAELDAERERRQALEELANGYHSGCAELRAELAAEREAHAELRKLWDAGNEAWNPVFKIVLDERDAARAELAARHAMLVRVRNYLYFLPSRDRALIDDIDALLQEKTDEG